MDSLRLNRTSSPYSRSTPQPDSSIPSTQENPLLIPSLRTQPLFDNTTLPDQTTTAISPDMSIPLPTQILSDSSASVQLVDSEFRAMVYLGEEKFYFDRRELRSPPIHHFAKDIPRLFAEWEKSNLLTINERGIPLKDWPRFYKHCVKRENKEKSPWSAIKVMWGNWKVRLIFVHVKPLIKYQNISSL